MPSCGPSCAVPSCASTPVVGFGSGSSRCAGYSLGSAGLGYGLGYGFGADTMAESPESLGTLAGVFPKCINQIPSSVVTIQPPACVLTIPGAIMSASCEPIAVGGYTPCAPGGFGHLGGGYLGGRLGSFSHRGSTCSLPCNLPC